MGCYLWVTAVIKIVAAVAAEFLAVATIFGGLLSSLFLFYASVLEFLMVAADSITSAAIVIHVADSLS